MTEGFGPFKELKNYSSYLLRRGMSQIRTFVWIKAEKLNAEASTKKPAWPLSTLGLPPGCHAAPCPLAAGRWLNSGWLTRHPMVVFGRKKM
jgi:hypothetical protein